MKHLPVKCVLSLILLAMLALATPAHEANAADAQMLKALAAADIFQGLSPAQLGTVAALGKLRQMQAGEKFIYYGRNMKRIFVLVSGRARVILASGEVAVQVAKNTTLGEMELVDGQPASATVLMITPGWAVVIEMAALKKAMAEDSGLGYVVMSQVARKISGQLRRRN